jgi:hypothetical protein
LAAGFGLFPATASAQTMNSQSSSTPTSAGTTQLKQVTYQGRKAYRLSDGRSEAIVVPEIGRVMSYGFVGGPNLLWNNPQKQFKEGEWRNYGGDKTWPAPQSFWPVYVGRGWPPLPEWDGGPQTAEVVNDGRLRTTSAVAKNLGARIVREYSFGADGDLVVAQTIEKVHGAPMLLSVWNVAQISAPQAVFLPTNPESAYKDNFYWWGKSNVPSVVTPLSPTLLQVRPTYVAPFSNGYKIGVDSTVASIAAMWGDTAFLIRTARPKGSYPDGPETAGFPVELYDSGATETEQHYIEMELLSPLRPFHVGTRWTHTMRWSLHRLPLSDSNSPAVHNFMEQLLKTPMPTADGANTAVK